MDIQEENTVSAVMDDLDNYGGHLPVAIVDINGRMYDVGTIATRTIRGQVYVTIERGDVID